MTDKSAAGDNERMKKTWEKLRTIKPQRLQEKAVGTEQPYIYIYAAYCTLRFSIPPIILEEAYLLTDIHCFTDFTSIDNRRVNDQKKTAIEVGRRQMGQQPSRQ